jgi:hypothetical protein
MATEKKIAQKRKEREKISKQKVMRRREYLRKEQKKTLLNQHVLCVLKRTKKTQTQT